MRTTKLRRELLSLQKWTTQPRKLDLLRLSLVEQGLRLLTTATADPNRPHQPKIHLSPHQLQGRHSDKQWPTLTQRPLLPTNPIHSRLKTDHSHNLVLAQQNTPLSRRTLCTGLTAQKMLQNSR